MLQTIKAHWRFRFIFFFFKGGFPPCPFPFGMQLLYILTKYLLKTRCLTEL